MLTKISYENFKCFISESFKLESLNVFCGTNSAGKSSVLQGLLLLLQNQNSILESLFLDKEEIPKFSMNGSLVSLGSQKSILNFEAKNDDVSIGIETNDQLVNIILKGKSWQLDKNSRKEIKDNPLLSFFSEKVSYLKTARISPERTYDLSEVDIMNNSIGTEGQYTAHYLAENRLEKLKNMKLKHPESSTDYLLENVSKWMNEISKGIELSAKIIPEATKAVLNFNYEIEGIKTHDIDAPNVGYGITHVLPVITLILKASPGDTLIIENPESQLHPSAQVRLGRLISLAAMSGVQLLIETHSDHIINSLRVSCKEKVVSPEKVHIYYLSKSESSLSSNVKFIKMDNEGSISSWPIGFFDEWEKQLDKLIW